MPPTRYLPKSRLDAAALRVQGELSTLGLWSHASRLPRTEVFWCALPQLTMPLAMAYFIHDSSRVEQWFGWVPGHIYVPALAVMKRPVLDVIRHEYAHALAHWNARLVQRAPEFTAAFGGSYHLGRPARRMRREDCVSDYAATQPMEDFAETFMVYVRRKGRLPRKAGEGLRRKWRFIDRLRAALGGTRAPSRVS